MLQRSDGKYTLINKKSGGGFIGFRVDNSDKMVINDYGNVGIGTTNPQAKLDVNGLLNAVEMRTNGLRLNPQDNVNEGGQILLMPSQSSFGWWCQDVNTTRLRFFHQNSNGDNLILNSNGNVSIGTYESSYKLDVVGTIRATQYACTSDFRYKKNITLYENALEKVLGLRGVTYFWNTEKYKDRSFGKEKQIGFIAQEVEKVIPEIVYTDDRGFKIMSYDRLTAVLVEAVKELKAEKDNEITSMKKVYDKEISSLKSENTTLKQRLAKFESLADRLALVEKELEKHKSLKLAER